MTEPSTPTLDRSVARHSMEMAVYLSMVLVALIAGFEDQLGEVGEVALIWGSSIGLSLAHIFAFRLAHIFDEGIALAEGWRFVGTMFATAFGVALLASIPYIIPFDSVSPSSVSIWVLLGVVAVMGYLATGSRGWGVWGRMAYSIAVLLLASLISIIKFFLAH